MRGPFSCEELAGARMARPFSFTKGCPVMKIPSPSPACKELPERLKTMLFDLKSDPLQLKPVSNAKVESRMITLLKRLMKENDVPAEQYKRLGL